MSVLWERKCRRASNVVNGRNIWMSLSVKSSRMTIMDVDFGSFRRSLTIVPSSMDRRHCPSHKRNVTIDSGVLAFASKIVRKRPLHLQGPRSRDHHPLTSVAILLHFRKEPWFHFRPHLRLLRWWHRLLLPIILLRKPVGVAMETIIHNVIVRLACS